MPACKRNRFLLLIRQTYLKLCLYLIGDMIHVHIIAIGFRNHAQKPFRCITLRFIQPVKITGVHIGNTLAYKRTTAELLFQAHFR